MLKQTEYRQLRKQFIKEFNLTPEEALKLTSSDKKLRNFKEMHNVEASEFNHLYKHFTYQHNNARGYGWYPVPCDFRDRWTKLLKQIARVSMFVCADCKHFRSGVIGRSVSTCSLLLDIEEKIAQDSCEKREEK